jgi:hypothetical protein
MQPRPWTAEDVLTLQAMARKHPPEQIAAELGRGVTATLVKAYELRIPLRIQSSQERDYSNLDPGPAGMDLKGQKFGGRAGREASCWETDRGLSHRPRLPRQNGCHSFFDHVAIATTIQFHVDKPKNTKSNASSDKAFHLEISSGGLVLKRSLSKNRPTLNQR